MVVKKEGVKSRTKLNSNKELYKKLAVIGIIVVLIMGVFLFVNLRGVGKAGYSPENIDGISYWEKKSMESTDETNTALKCSDPSYCYTNKDGITKGCYAPNTIYKLFNEQFGYFCRGTDIGNPSHDWVICNALSVYNTVMSDHGGLDKFYCDGVDHNFYPCGTYAMKNNLLRKAGPSGLDVFLCVADDNKWWTCSDQLEENDRLKAEKFYCEISDNHWSWKECNSNIEDKNSDDNKYYCDGTQWKLITAQNPGQLSNQYVTQDKTYICSQTENKNGIQNAMYCDDSKYLWYPCNQYNKFSISLNKKAYCGDEEWSFCVEKEILPSVNDAAPNKGQFLCDDSVNTWLTCTKTTTNKLMFLDQFYCNLNATSQKWSWEKCSAEWYLSGDQTKVCIDSKWVECTQAGINPTKSNYYCDGKLWQTCDSNSMSKVVKETNNKYLQCLGGTWIEKTCTPDKKDPFVYNLSTNPNLPIFRCDGTNWKSYEFVNKDLYMSTNLLFEVTINKNKKIKTLNGLSNLTICDMGTELLADRATYCLTNNKLANQKQAPITSLSHLTATGEKLVINNTPYGKLTFLYETEVSSEDKVMSIVLVADVTSTITPVTFTAGNFYQNFLSQQRLVLLQSGEYYLLSYPQAESFKLENIELYHLPDLKKYQPKSLALGSMIEFSTEAGKVINIEISGNNVKISSQKSALIGTGVVYPADLFFDFETVVDIDNPVNLLNPKLKVGTKDVTKIYICDKESLVEKLDICYNNETNKKTLQSLSSLQILSKGKIYKETIDSNTQVALIYGKEILDPETKNVKIILAKNISSVDATFDSNLFAKNLREKRRLVINLNGEDYLLSHPEGNYFSYASLTLRHLPTWNDYPLYLKGPVYLPSLKVNGIQFKVFDQLITIYQIGDTTYISSKLLPGEATSYALPLNLDQSYETSFSKGSPVELVDFGNTIVGVCDTDNAGDTWILQACQNDKSWMTVVQNNLSKTRLVNENLVLLYQFIEIFKEITTTSTDALGNAVNKTSSVKTGTKKQGYVFLWKQLSKVTTELNYNNFIDNLRAGKRLTLEFQGKIYLLQHPIADSISLPSLSLNLMDGDNNVQIPSSGSEKKVTFSLPDGGRMTLFREFSLPPPPFKVFAQTKQEIADIPVNLTEQLHTTFTSESPIKITSPSLGVVHSNDGADYKKVEAFFKIKLDGLNQQITLSKDVPYVLSNNNLLFYYDQAYFVGDLPIKTVKVYWMTNLANNNYHDLNNDFIDTFTSGNELALKFDKSYYLLGYDGASSNTKQFFKENKVSLRRLNDSQAYSSKITEEGITYLVPEGKIIVKFDYSHNQIIFSKTLQSDVITEEFLIDEYSHQLTTKNKVKVGDITLSICSQKIYGDMPNVAGVCANDKLLKDQPLENYGTFSFGNEPYLLEVNSEIGDQKVVTIRKIGPITTTGKTLDDWESFSQHLMDKDQPIVNLSGDLYLPSAEDSQLKNFGMQEYDQIGITYPENLMMKKAGVFNGTFVLKDKLLFVEQTLVAADQRSISLKLEDYKIVPYYGEWELNGLGASLVTKINGKKYFFWEDSVSFPGLIDFSIVDSSSGKFIIHKYFKIGDIKYVTLDGVQIKIEFITKNKVPTVLISRP